MSEKKREQFKQQQLKKYYVRPFQYAPVKIKPKDPFEDAIQEEQMWKMNYKNKLKMSPNQKQR